MRPVTHDYQSLNEYTLPLQGKPYYRSSGIIYAVDRNGNKYAVGQVDLERFDDQNFQYVFTPEWSVIDTLPSSIFQGIPGLDMSMRLERYYRVNMTPYFISERTPSESREDLWELLEAVGLDYYDRFEWLLRTDMRCGTDNLIVDGRARTRVPHLNRSIVAGTDIPANQGPCYDSGQTFQSIGPLQKDPPSGRYLEVALIPVRMQQDSRQPLKRNACYSKPADGCQESMKAKRTRDKQRHQEVRRRITTAENTLRRKKIVFGATTER